MKNKIYTLLGAVALEISMMPAKAQSVKRAFYELPKGGSDQLTARMFTDFSSVKKRDTFRLAINFEVSPGWYTYSENDTNENLLTEISLDLPKGLEVIKVMWPEPKIATVRSGDEEEIYTKDFNVIYFIKNNTVSTSTEKISAIINWQVCDSSICKIGGAKSSTTITEKCAGL